MTDTTPRTALPLLAAAQAQKHVTHNEALLEIDTLLYARFLDRDLTAPPSAPADGDTYLVKATATGAWAGQDGQVASALDGAWRFAAPFTGLSAYVVDESKLIVFTGGAWADYASILDLQNVPLVGVNTTADATNKLAVKSSALLFDNIGNGVQAKLNKHAATDTASLLYQDNYSGRAEIGLCGDDDFHFKVSPDGSTWHEAIRIASATGIAAVDLGLTAGGIGFGDPASGGGVAQDGANLFWDATDHRLGIGTATPDVVLTINQSGAATPVALSATTALHVQGTATANRTILLEVVGSTPNFTGRRLNGSYAAPTACVQNDTIVNLAGSGYNGASVSSAANFALIADEAWSSGAAGVRFELQLTANGTTSRNVVQTTFGDGRHQHVGAQADASYSYQTPTTGFAITIANVAGRLILNPAGTLASGTITMPAAPKDGQLCRIASTQAVTALTLSPNTGQSVAGALTAIAAGGFAEYTYVAATTTWYRTG